VIHADRARQGGGAQARHVVQYTREVFGEHEPSMQINFGGIGEREAMRTLELFAERVMPKFNREGS
jgi:hypothetical protein